MMKRNDGFTMVELLVTIAAAAVVTIAVASLILLGVRIQHASTADAAEQQNVRIVLTMLEKMVGNGEIHAVENTEFGWKLLGEKAEDAEKAPVLFEYVAEKQVLYSVARENEENKSILLEDLNGAGARMDGKVLHFTFNTARGGHYETAIYCRSASSSVTVGHGVSDDSLRYLFLKTLIKEYGNGSNIGKDTETGQYYAQWYSQEKMGITWPEDTPWCACFLTWAAVKSGAIESDSIYFFADVKTGIDHFRDANGDLKSTPEVGDYVFFDWSGGNDPDHVGVVLREDGNYIYTIEGNSGGVIAVRKYRANSNVIMGYGSIFPAS